MFRRIVAVATLLLLTSAAASAQTLRETIDVTVSNVEVVVVDRRGNPVEGLTLDDFELYVDGLRVPITNFYAGTFETSGRRAEPRAVATGDATAPAESAESHLVMVYLDESTFSHEVAKNYLVRQLEKFFDSLSSTCGTCRVSLHARRGRELVTLTGPTADAAVLKGLVRAEMKASERTALATRQKLNRMRSELGFAPLYASLLDSEARKQRFALAEVIGSVAETSGRKILLLVSSLPVLRVPDINSAVAQAPGLGVAAVSADVASELQPRNMAEALALAPAEYDRVSDLYADLRGGSSLVTLANAAGVSIYPIISTGIIDMEMWSSAERAMAPAVGMRPTNSKLSDLMAGVEALAYATGGRMQPPSNDFSVALDRAGKELRSYYSLGFRTRTEGAAQKIEVRVPGRSGVVVRARSSMKFLRDEEKVELAALAASASERGGPVVLTAEIVNREAGARRERLKIRFSVPLDQIVWRTGDDGEHADLRIVLKAVGDSGGISDVHSIPLSLKRGFGDPQQTFSDVLDLDIRREPQDLVIMVEDANGRTTSWKTVRVE
jgi:VWFA-related protein